MPSWKDHSESAEDGFFGPEADIWGCGVVFFCILTGSLAKTTKTSKDNTPEEALTIWHISHIPIPSSSLRHEDFAVHLYAFFPVVSFNCRHLKNHKPQNRCRRAILPFLAGGWWDQTFGTRQEVGEKQVGGGATHTLQLSNMAMENPPIYWRVFSMKNFHFQLPSLITGG